MAPTIPQRLLSTSDDTISYQRRPQTNIVSPGYSVHQATGNIRAGWEPGARSRVYNRAGKRSKDQKGNYSPAASARTNQGGIMQLMHRFCGGDDVGVGNWNPLSDSPDQGNGGEIWTRLLPRGGGTRAAVGFVCGAAVSGDCMGRTIVSRSRAYTALGLYFVKHVYYDNNAVILRLKSLLEHAALRCAAHARQTGFSAELKHAPLHLNQSGSLYILKCRKEPTLPVSLVG
ncbi:hypothetical protein BJY04DRAFT_219267 [Aspergillus karnatakaensis]|uniref:uncharacterized protein n=1 Tax=Aspergillus karnatakaensis TaxID=1810916 RepID=UPI003CCDC245